MMTKNAKFSGEYYQNAFGTANDLEGSGSSERIDFDITASENSSAPARKLINLESSNQESHGVPLQVLSLSHMSPSERKDLIRRLRYELDQIRMVQKKVEMQRVNAVTLSSSSDILSCSYGTNVQRDAINSVSGKKANPNPVCNGRDLRRNSYGRFKSVKKTPVPTATDVMLMKQCETLLTRLFNHQFGWLFKEPVDAVKLNIPDYHTIIKHPMDFGTIRSKLNSGSYSSPLKFADDVRLTFRNAMEYNPKGHEVHIMADSLHKYFEQRWKPIEKKLPKTEPQVLPEKSRPCEKSQFAELSPIKKRKIDSNKVETVTEPVKRVMTAADKQDLKIKLESLLAEIPKHIFDFLREQSSNGKAGEEEIEIDIDELNDDTLFTLRKLLDDYLLEKQKSQQRVEHCEIELFNEYGVSNSSTHKQKVYNPADEDVDIGGNEPPVSSYSPMEIQKDAGCKGNRYINSVNSGGLDSDSSSEGDSEDAKTATQNAATKVPENLDSVSRLDDTSCGGDRLEKIQSVSGLDQLEQTSQQKPSSVESDFHQDGESAPGERQVSPDKLIRAAILKNRFADTILKAREKTRSQVKGDPEKLKREMEELEMQKKREKARLQAEAKAAEDAQRRAQAAAAAEARKKRELEREAARQALLQMEKTVEINENPQLLEDLEMLRVAPVEQLPSSVDETSPEHSQDGFGGFRFSGTNPLEQLGLFMKHDEEEEEGEPLNFSNHDVNDMEEGEID